MRVNIGVTAIQLVLKTLKNELSDPSISHELSDTSTAHELPPLPLRCIGGELFELLNSGKNQGFVFREDRASRLMRDMLSAVHYLHSKGIVHRDLKLENFLFEAKNSSSPLVRAILIVPPLFFILLPSRSLFFLFFLHFYFL